MMNENEKKLSLRLFLLNYENTGKHVVCYAIFDVEKKVIHILIVTFSLITIYMIL